MADRMHRMHSPEELLEATPAVLWAFDADGVCTFARGGGLQALGYTSSHLAGVNLLEAFPADTESGQLIRRTLAGEAVTIEHEPAPGAFVQTIYRPLHDPDDASGAVVGGAIVGGVALTLDVTHRRAREDEAHRASLVARISKDLAEQATRGPQALAQAVAETVAEVIGDTALMLNLDEDGAVISPFALAGRDPAVLAAVRESLPLWQSVSGWSGGQQAFRAGLPLVVDQLPRELLDLMRQRLSPELIAALDIGTMMMVPTRDAGHVNGEIVVLRRKESPPLSESERLLLEDLGERVGLALANARLLDTAQRLMTDRRALLGHLIDAEELERKRIAHDIHDDTIQVLAAVDLRLQLLRRKMAARSDCQAELDVLDALRESTQAATSRLRQLLFSLQPPALETGGIGNALRQLGDDLFAGSAVVWTVVDNLDVQPDPATASVLFRVGKEAVTNARKHSDAQHVNITIDRHVGGFRLTVADDGVGLPAARTTSEKWPHFGLETMRDRTRVAGGTFAVQPRRTGGTTVVAWLPAVTADP